MNEEESIDVDDFVDKIFLVEESILIVFNEVNEKLIYFDDDKKLMLQFLVDIIVKIKFYLDILYEELKGLIDKIFLNIEQS